MPNTQSQTVVVENPMSVDSSGKLVNDFFILMLFGLCIFLVQLQILSFVSQTRFTDKFKMLQVSNVVVGVTTDKK